MQNYFIMAQRGEVLQNYNTDLVKLIGELKQKHENTDVFIQETKDKKSELEEELSKLKTELAEVNKSLATKETLKKSLLSAIQKTEQAYMNILDSSLTLLNSVKEENAALV